MCCSSLPPLFCVFFNVLLCVFWLGEGGRIVCESIWTAVGVVLLLLLCWTTRVFLSVHLLLLLLAFFCCSHSALCCVCSRQRSAAYFLQFSSVTTWTSVGASCSVEQRARSSACTCSCSCSCSPRLRALMCRSHSALCCVCSRHRCSLLFSVSSTTLHLSCNLKYMICSM